MAHFATAPRRHFGRGLPREAQFRRLASTILKEYIIKIFAMNGDDKIHTFLLDSYP